ncbi:MAG: MinD/ParA family protein [Dethiosulfovibrio sp.]|nr:MinD/ParA family protein [Dethiosulfovibrio sp.]
MADIKSGAVDQAAELRRMMASVVVQPSSKISRSIRSIAVVGGKGGVGKSNLSVNLALAMGQQDVKVALLDGDLGLANVDILLGVQPEYNLIHLVRGEKDLKDVICSVGDQVFLVPGGAGVEELANLDDNSQSALIDKLADLDAMADIIIVDTGAGIHKNMVSFALAVDTVILVTTPEPTSIRDAYGLLKSLVFSAMGKLDVKVLVNMAVSQDEAKLVSDRMRFAASQFLRMDLGYAGYVLLDPKLTEAVRARKPLLRLFPRSAASECIRMIAMDLLESEERIPGAGKGVKSLFFKLSRRLGMKVERG